MNRRSSDPPQTTACIRSAVRSSRLLWASWTLPLAILGSAFARPVFAQDTADSPTATITVRSQLVVLDVVVTDKKGNLVKNLGRDDFSVYENGIKQEIRNFDGPQGKPSLPAVAPKDKNGRDDWGDAPLTIFVIDALNTTFDETAFSRQQVDRYLKAQPSLLIQPAIVLWLNDSGFHPISSFTRDRNALIATIDAHKASLPTKLERGDLVEQLGESLSALQQVALFSRGQKGNKEIVWVGQSLPSVDGSQLSDHALDILHKAIRSTLDLLLESRATIYVIDPTQDTIEPVTPAISTPSPDVTDPDSILPYTTATDPFLDSFDFKSFAIQTGGKYFAGRNDLNNEIADGIERGMSFYSLSYVPTTPVEDGAYRKIEIRLSDPNLVVQAKQGYYPSAPEQTSANAKDLRFDLYEASITGMVYTGIALRAEGCTSNRYPTDSVCSVVVDNDSLTFGPGPGDTQVGEITAVISALGAKQQLLANRVSEMGVRLSSQRPGSGGSGVTKFQLHLAIPPTAKTIRIVVRDTSGRIGTADLDTHKLLAPTPPR
jgi:VWFA-related protein